MHLPTNGTPDDWVPRFVVLIPSSLPPHICLLFGFYCCFLSFLKDSWQMWQVGFPTLFHTSGHLPQLFCLLFLQFSLLVLFLGGCVPTLAEVICGAWYPLFSSGTVWPSPLAQANMVMSLGTSSRVVPWKRYHFCWPGCFSHETIQEPWWWTPLCCAGLNEAHMFWSLVGGTLWVGLKGVDC